jgi:large subunit ribosomal protein L5
MNYDLQKYYKEKVIPKMMKEFGYKNPLAVPEIDKVVVNTGTGSVKDEAQKERIEKHLALITGQKPSKRPAKKPIASFKIRQGSHIGYSVTLRGRRMYDFLSRLIFVAIPRQRDFRGLSLKSVDESGNLTIGFKDHLVFPEMADEDVRNAFGFSVTVVTTAGNKRGAVEFLKVLGFPFKKEI